MPIVLRAERAGNFGDFGEEGVCSRVERYVTVFFNEKFWTVSLSGVEGDLSLFLEIKSPHPLQSKIDLGCH